MKFQKFDVVLEACAEYTYQNKVRKVDKTVNSPQNLYEIATALKLQKQTVENFVVIAFDTKLKCIGALTVGIGTVNTCLTDQRRIFQFLLLCNAVNFAVVHNHPSGDVRPSNEDKTLVTRLKELGQLLNIKLIDAMIVGTPESDETSGSNAKRYYSFAEEVEEGVM
jgi:DNA repair protein RadC